ncbi:ISAs1 family transposase [Phocaeicola vulgatus]|uniref:ISAs1 family transposase n=1 Tax=Phocaeicola vulgatus TaxID=821 RepID=UPI002078FBBA
MVSAWSAANGISLGQVKVDDKSNEITAIPLLINSLELSGCIVTIDAMGCQKDITQTIIEHDANYIIAIKENKKKNYQPAKQIIDYYQDRDEIINRVTRHVSENAGYGRIEKRNCTVVSYGSMERTIVATGEYTQEVRYYVTSLDNTQPEEIASAIRQHWSIENNLHWQLDVTFREDYSKKVKNAARNFSVATKMALTMLKNEKTTKGSMNLKRLKAGWDENYLSQLLRDNNF